MISEDKRDTVRIIILCNSRSRLKRYRSRDLKRFGDLTLDHRFGISPGLEKAFKFINSALEGFRGRADPVQSES